MWYEEQAAADGDADSSYGAFKGGQLGQRASPYGKDLSQMKHAEAGDWICPACGDHQFSRNVQCRKCQTPNPQLSVSDPVVDEFLAVNEIQDHAAARFKSLDKETQIMIMERGSLEGARDKTAVLMTRMRQARDGTLQGASAGVPFANGAGGYANLAKGGGGGVAAAGGNSGNMKQMMGMMQQMMSVSNVPPPMKMMMTMMSQMMAKESENTNQVPQAWASSKPVLRRQSQAAASNAIPSVSQGDWYCPECNDLQFSRNAHCRKCGVANPRLADSDPIVDEFLMANDIQEHVQIRFKALDKETQELIMNRGSLQGSRDPSAVLVSRMNKARQGMLEPNPGTLPTPGEGDWYCPNCGDLQFRRNTQCRKCGHPHPGRDNATQNAQAQAADGFDPSQWDGDMSQFGDIMQQLQQMTG